MSEMRWHPLREEWVVIASHRQRRTYHPPPGACPLCPARASRGFHEVPRDNYDVVVFENRFPTLQRTPPRPSVRGTAMTPVRPSRGICEVVLYSPRHDVTFAELPLSQIYKLVRVWTDRYLELGARPFIRFVYVFENKGEAVGVTLSHPHGQIYAFSFLPPVIERELAASRRYFLRRRRCLVCDAATSERRERRRMLFSGGGFDAFVPFYARWPYEVHIVSRRHVQDLAQFEDRERWGLSRILKRVALAYDALFGFSMPYMMILRQRPTDGRPHRYCHFRVEFCPLHRTADKIKYQAGCETGAGTFSNDVLPEHAAAALRRAARKVPSF